MKEVDLRVVTDSNLDSYTCTGADSLGSTVCGELFKITILDNDLPGVQVGDVPPADTGLLDSYVPSAGARSATLQEGVEFGSDGSYDFGLMLRAQPSGETQVEAHVYDNSSVGRRVQIDPGSPPG